MEYCDICFDPPGPLPCTVTGTLRLDAMDGARRLLGEATLLRTPLRLHAVEVSLRRRLWQAEGWALCGVTVTNRSTLPLTRVAVSPGVSAFLDGSIRVNGAPAAQAVIDGLGPGCAAVVTWEAEQGEAAQASSSPATADYSYRFGGTELTGSAQSS